MTKNKTELTVSYNTLFRIIVVVLGSVLLLRAIVALAHPITLILVAFFLAMALNPAVSWVSRHLKGKSRTLPTAVAFITVLVALTTFFSLVIPPLITQVSDFVGQIPSTVQNLKTEDSTVGRAVRKYGLDKQIDTFNKDFTSRVGAKPVLNTFTRVTGTLVSILAVLAMTFMMLNEGPTWLKRLSVLIPEDEREQKKEMVYKMYRMVTGYVNGQLIMASIAASFFLVFLLVTSTLLHVSVNAVALAGILAIFGLIPMIGNPLGAVFVVSACLLASPQLAIIVLIYFVIYGQIENVTLQPYIQSRQNELTPLTVFVAALIGISYGGILGALFAIPVAGCLRILLIDWAQRKGYYKSDRQPG